MGQAFFCWLESEVESITAALGKKSWIQRNFLTLHVLFLKSLHIRL